MKRLLGHSLALVVLLATLVFAQAPAPRPFKVVKLDPALDAIVATDAKIEILGEHFGLTEGPVWIQDPAGGYLLFNDMLPSRRMKYSPGVGVTVATEQTGGANGLTLDLQGRLISAERDTRRVTRTEVEGTISIVADRYLGKRLRPPNDVVVKSDGAIYSTTPGGTCQESPTTCRQFLTRSLHAAPFCASEASRWTTLKL